MPDNNKPSPFPCLQRKIDNMTRMMLDGGRTSGEGAKPRKENRRETWCPGAGGAGVAAAGCGVVWGGIGVMEDIE